jgi:hypothetical protein
MECPGNEILSPEKPFPATLFWELFFFRNWLLILVEW